MGEGGFEDVSIEETKKMCAFASPFVDKNSSPFNLHCFERQIVKSKILREKKK